METAKNISEMPIELLLTIFNFLPNTDFFNTVKVNKKFYALKKKCYVPANFSFQVNHAETISKILKISEDSLALGFFDGKLIIYNVASSQIKSFFFHNDVINDLVMLNERCLLSASSDGFIGLLDVVNEKLLRKIKRDDYIVTCLSPLNSTSFMAGSTQNSIAVYSTGSNKTIELIKACDDKFNYFLPHHILQLDEQFMLVCGSNNKIYLFNKQTGKIVRQFIGHTDIVKSIILVGDMLVSASSDRTIRLWNIKNELCLNVLNGHAAAINKLIKIDDSQFISASNDGTLRLWDVKFPHALYVFHQTNHPVTDVVLFKENKIIATSCNHLLGWCLPKNLSITEDTLFQAPTLN